MTKNPPPVADLPEVLSRQIFIYVMLGCAGFMAAIAVVMFLIPVTG